MTVQGNCGTLDITQRAKLKGYTSKPWFSKKEIMNILSFKNMIKQYRVTYDSNEKMFAVHRKESRLPNMEFRMHSSGLHVYYPEEHEKKNMVFMNTVYQNKQAFNKREIKQAKAERKLYGKLLFPSTKDFRWMTQFNKIKNCEVTVRDIYVDHEIWGKDISSMKGKTTRS